MRLRDRHIGLLASLFFGAAASAAPVATEHSRVDLIAEAASLPADGGVITVGLHLQPDPGWHAYWVNPGDAGLPAKLKWTLPDGFAAAEPRFPTPHLIPFGDLVTYGFDEPILLLVDITVPTLAPAATWTLSAEARWVVCDDELCVPERAKVSIALPVGAGRPAAEHAQRFQTARAKVPRPVDWPARFEAAGEQVRVAVRTPDAPAGGVGAAYLFVAGKHLVRYGRQEASYAPRGVIFSMDAGIRFRGEPFTAVLAFQDAAGDHQAVWLDVRPGADLGALVAGAGDGSAVPAASDPASAANAVPAAGAAAMSFGFALLFAFLGGVVLNLMPCVFPILSMKALSLVHTSHGDRAAARQSGLLYTAGILVAFAVVGSALLALRAAGEQVGWGFQMQSASVNLALALLMVAIAMNLLGVFEIGTRVSGVGEGLASGAGSERRAAFFTGLLAVVVATPCTAPFMAGALGYALVQPPAVALGVFLLLGAGLAFPYLLASWVPAVGRLMPRPGPWMATFRSFLSFPMFATAVWLLWIIGNQRGPDGMALGLLAGLAVALALWAYGRAFGNARAWLWRATAVAGLAAAVGLGFKVRDAQPSASAGVARLGALEQEAFAPERVAGYLRAGQPLFLYFTADWCVSCKVNERVALKSRSVADAFQARGIKVMAADWTNEDPVITEWLRRYGRVGVPLYLYFPSGASLETATILPQILVPDTVIGAVAAADAAA